MDWMIHDLEIKNFKSIKEQKIKCKRINVFIGKPNVGKSNILEAVSLLGGYNDDSVFHLDPSAHKEQVFSDIVRYEKFRNLYYDNDRSLQISIKSNLGYFFSKFHQNNIEQYDLLFGQQDALIELFSKDHEDYSIHLLNNTFQKYLVDNKDSVLPDPAIKPFYFTVRDDGSNASGSQHRENKYWGNIKKYEFKKDIPLISRNANYLKPPFGENVFMLLESYPKIFDEVSEIFDEYGLQLLFDSETNKLELQKTIGKRVYKIPYSLCADTLRRYIFNLLAIRTNKQSILVLEEPEAHSFPKYIAEIAKEIVNDKSNQYFIATHSPYLLTEFLDNCDKDELALFICDYKDYQTTIRELTRDEISNIKDEGVDLFYNLSAFQ